MRVQIGLELERLRDEVRAADGAGLEARVEALPGRVLAGMVKRTLGRDLETANAGNADELQGLAEAVD